MKASAVKGTPCGRMTIQFEGVLDPNAARKTLARLVDLPCDDVVLDLSRATGITDVGLAFLAGGLERAGRSHVLLIGLGRHHQRLLEYLGAGALLVPTSTPHD